MKARTTHKAMLEASIKARREMRKHGGYTGGQPPFGFRLVRDDRMRGTLVPDEAETAAIASMKELRAQGLSFRAIQAAVQEKHAIEVSVPTVRTVLRREGA